MKPVTGPRAAARPAWIAVAVLAACGSRRPLPQAAEIAAAPDAGPVSLAVVADDAAVSADAATAPSGELVLTYDGEAFEGPGWLSIAFVAADGTSHSMRLAAVDYTVYLPCSKCPADGPSRNKHPMNSKPPARTYSPGRLLGYAAAELAKDVVIECPAGGQCIGKQPLPPGGYTLKVGSGLSCPGTVSVPLVDETELICTR